jgi:hypothetical protein
MVRYYGYDSNVSRGKRQEGLDDAIPCILKPQGHEKACRNSWARLIQQDRRRRSPGLPDMSGDDADHQCHRGPVGDPGPPHSSGTMAGKRKPAPKRSLPANPSNTPLAISSVTHARRLSTVTPNTPGMKTDSHHTLWTKACRRGLSALCPQMPSCRVTRHKMSCLLKRAAADPSSLPNRITSPCLSMLNIH